jgi:hypothetical protein
MATFTSPAINMGVYLSLLDSDLDFYGCQSVLLLDHTLVCFLFGFLRNLQNFFDNDHTNLHSQQKYKKVSSSPVFVFFCCSFFFHFSFIIHMCIQGLVHFTPLPPPPLPPTPPAPSPPPSIPSRNYFALISNFVIERV